MRSIAVSTDLSCSADAAFDALGSIQAFVHVARGVIRFPAVESITEPLRPGDEFVGWTFLFGVVPLTRHTLGIVELDPARRVLVSNEAGGFVRRWDHTITVEPTATGCRYEDRIDIDAGVLTPVVVAFAHAFYRYRQRRWRRLAPVLDGAARVRVRAEVRAAGTDEHPDGSDPGHRFGQIVEAGGELFDDAREVDDHEVGR